MPGAICMASVFLVTLAEMVFSPARHACACPGCDDNDDVARLEHAPGDNDQEIGGFASTSNAGPGGDFQGTNEMSHVADKQTHETSNPSGVTVDNASVLQNGVNADQSKSLPATSRAREPFFLEDGVMSRSSILQDKDFVLTPEQRFKKEATQVTLLELGLLFHSPFVGMAIGVSAGTEFVVLLIAIAFHRTYTTNATVSSTQKELLFPAPPSYRRNIVADEDESIGAL